MPSKWYHHFRPPPTKLPDAKMKQDVELLSKQENKSENDICHKYLYLYTHKTKNKSVYVMKEYSDGGGPASAT